MAWCQRDLIPSLLFPSQLSCHPYMAFLFSIQRFLLKLLFVIFSNGCFSEWLRRSQEKHSSVLCPQCRAVVQFVGRNHFLHNIAQVGRRAFGYMDKMFIKANMHWRRYQLLVIWIRWLLKQCIGVIINVIGGIASFLLFILFMHLLVEQHPFFSIL